MRVRKATMRDIPPLVELINGYAAQGIMLPRSDLDLAEDIRDFVIVEEEAGVVAGCGALHCYTPEAGEIRSLAVRAEGKKRGVGRRVVEALEEEALAVGLASLFAFTYVPGFFEQLGYRRVDRGLLPQKAWKDCLRCPKFQACDETAMHRILDPTRSGAGTPALTVLRW